MQWFVNIYNWIVENLTPIIAWLSTGEIAAIITIICVTIRNMRTTRHGAFLTDRLNDSLLENHKFTSKCVTTIEDMDRRTTNIEESVKDALAQINFINEQLTKNFDLINSKISAMMEVQTLVYSTINDEDLRNAISNILTSAKYKDYGVQTEIVNEISKMKEQFDSTLSEMKSTIDSAIKGLNAINTAPDTKNTTGEIVRY